MLAQAIFTVEEASPEAKKLLKRVGCLDSVGFGPGFGPGFKALLYVPFFEPGGGVRLKGVLDDLSASLT